MEHWNNGMMGWFFTQYSIIPTFQYSSFHYSILPTFHKQGLVLFPGTAKILTGLM
jgi:hypothetical protein